MKKISIVFSILVGFCSEIAAIQLAQAVPALKTVFSPAVIAPVAGVAVRMMSSMRRTRKQQEKNSTALQVMRNNEVEVPTEAPVKTIAQLEEENRRFELELRQTELKNKLAARTIDTSDLDHKQQKAKLFSTYVSAAAEISMQVLMWSVRIWGFKTPFGGGRD